MYNPSYAQQKNFLEQVCNFPVPLKKLGVRNSMWF